MKPADHVDTVGGEGARAFGESKLQEWLTLAARRRRFVVDRPYQIRVSLLAVGVALILLVLLNLSLFYAARQNAEVAANLAPNMAEYVRSQNQAQFGIVLTGSLVFLVGVFLVAILESHRTAGAAYRIAQGLESLRLGDYASKIRLRRADNLQEVAAGVNALAGTLREQTWTQIDAIEGIAARLEGVATDPIAQEAAQGLRALAVQARGHLG